MTKLRALIFDVDGTLANTEQDGHRVAFNRAFAEAGFDWDWSVSLYGELLAVAGGKERIRYYLKQYRPDFQPPANFDEFIANLHRAKTHHYQQLIATGSIPLRPGVQRLMKAARSQGIRLAIATTSALANVTALLLHTLGDESLAWFDAIAAGDIVPAKKPAPDIYNHVLRQMDLPCQDCLAIEDSDQGLIAATQAGITTIITVNNYTKDQEFTQAVLVLNHLGEPDQPFTVLAGDAGDKRYVDIELLNHLHHR
ncbi:MAG: HAD family hydrolase [Coleofasciculus sp. C2-GNP5-27]